MIQPKTQCLCVQLTCAPVDVQIPFNLDFAKAFDKVYHKRLKVKIEAHGITAKVSQWIEQWLTNRTQRVVINGETSSNKPVYSGVSQVSVSLPKSPFHPREPLTTPLIRAYGQWLSNV